MDHPRGYNYDGDHTAKGLVELGSKLAKLAGENSRFTSFGIMGSIMMFVLWILYVFLHFNHLFMIQVLKREKDT